MSRRIGKKHCTESTFGDERRNGKRPRIKLSFFGTLLLDIVAHIVRFMQHGTEKRTAADKVDLLLAGVWGNLAFVNWTHEFHYVSNRHSSPRNVPGVKKPRRSMGYMSRLVETQNSIC